MEFAWSEREEAYRAELREVLNTLPDNWWSEIAPGGPSSPRLMEHARIFNTRLTERDLIVRHRPKEYGGVPGCGSATGSPSASGFPTSRAN